jgi:hypothetical protein
VQVVAARLGVAMVATDGDDQVLSLLQDNIGRQGLQHETGVGAGGGGGGGVGEGGSVRVCKLLWGEAPDLGLPAPSTEAQGRLLLATGVVYGDGGADGDNNVGWAGLVESLVSLSDERSVVLLCHGQGAAPGVANAEGDFFKLLAPHFDLVTVPSITLAPDFRRSSVIHALRRKGHGTTSQPRKRKKSKSGKSKDRKKKPKT